MKRNKLITIVFAGMAMISCNNSKQGMGIRLENLDTSVKPGDDFFQFADGVGMRFIRLLTSMPVTAVLNSWPRITVSSLNH